MTDQSPATLSDIEILDILQTMKNDELDTEAKKSFVRVVKRVVRKRINRRWLYWISHLKKNLLKQFLWPWIWMKRKSKIRYKKDRIRILKARGIDYLAIDGAETAFVLAQIAQAILREDAVVTHDLHNIFPFWKEGWPMVQFDNAYKILQEDIQIHYQAVLEALLSKSKLNWM